MNRVARTLLATAASLMSGQALAQEELPFVRTDAESLEHARSWCGKLNENTSLNCDVVEATRRVRIALPVMDQPYYATAMCSDGQRVIAATGRSYAPDWHLEYYNKYGTYMTRCPLHWGASEHKRLMRGQHRPRLPAH
jgi:hypothetical protein